MTAGQGLQTGAKGAAETFNRFVEGQDEKSSSAAANRGNVEPERKDFWDSFGEAAEQKTTNAPKNSSIGTSAMKKTNTNAPQANPPVKSKDDGWGDDW